MCSQRTTATLQEISPIKWLPDEMLTEIFFHCLPEDHHFSRTLAPLSICWVCQVWRTLALSNSSFWKKLSFWTPTESKRDLLCYPTRLVNQWLAHSRSSPLQLCFEPELSRSDLKTFADLVLLEHYSQCQHLELSVSSLSARGLINFINLPPGSLSSLESLVLDGLDEAHFLIEEDDDDEDATVPITVFESSPKLEKFVTSSLDFMFHVSGDKVQFNAPAIPWPPLTHILITNFINIEVFVHALVECLALQFLRVSLRAAEDEEHGHARSAHFPRHVILPNLTALCLSVDGGSCFPAALNIFHLPALTAVHFRRKWFEGRDLFSWDNSGHFVSQLRHAEHLSLTGHVGPTEQIISLLRRTPAVTNLMLDISINYMILLPVLFSPDAASLLPYLVHLELHLEGQELCYPRVPQTDVIEIIKSGNMVRRMRSISVDSLQPCIFRIREMIESSQPSLLRSIRLFPLRGPSCEKSLREFRNQFRSSILTTHFEKKYTSLRHGCSDRDLMENAMTNFILT